MAALIPGRSTASAWSRSATRAPHRWALICAAGLALSACLDGSAGKPAHTQAQGTWAYSSAGCEQLLTLDEDGRFVFAISAKEDHARIQETVEGNYRLDPKSSTKFDIQFVPDSSLDPHAMAYCSQWSRREDVALSSADLESALGVAPSELVWHEEVSDALGKVVIAAGADGTDQFAVYQHSRKLKALRLDQYGGYSPPLYRELPSQVTRNISALLPVPDVAIPEAFYSRSFPVTSDLIGFSLDAFVLHVLAASDVEVSVSGTGIPNCRLVAYTDDLYTDPIDPPVFDVAALNQVVRINPLDDAVPTDEEILVVDGVPRTVLLLPVAVLAMQEGTCTVNIHPRPAAVAILDAMVSSGNFEPLFSVAIPVNASHAILYPLGHELFPRRVKMIEPLLARGLNGIPSHWVSTPSLDSENPGADSRVDILGLTQETPRKHRLSVGNSGGHAWMNLYNPETQTGLGPFTRFIPSKPAEELGFPAEVSRTIKPDGQLRVFRFEVDSKRRVSFWSEGAPDTHAVLIDSEGLVIADDESGAPDGRGFRIVRTVPAGRYDLQVGGAGSGRFKLHAGPASDLPLQDEALFACLNSNHANFEAIGNLTELYCFGEGIKSLKGLDAATHLEVLELGSNAIHDLSPLTGLTRLRVLGLAGNEISNLEALSGLTALLVLNVAGNPVDAKYLYTLKSLAGHLRELDIRGVSGLSDGQLSKLRQKLPHSLIVGPDGAMIP